MKVVGVNASARRDGNTSLLIEQVFAPLREAGVECELVQLAGKRIHGCIACGKCGEDRTGNCSGINDGANEVIAKMVEADGIVLGSPVYFGDVTPELKAIIDRAGMATRNGGELLARKVGAAVVAVRRAGAMHAFDTINHFFFITQMIVPGSSYWNIGVGRDIGEVELDAEGLRTMERLGENMGWLLNRLHD